MRNTPQATKPLSQLETLVMRFIWSHGEATADAIREALASEHAMKDATVRTILRRLEHKGYVAHRVEGRTYVYSGVRHPQKVAAGVVRQLLDRFCGGSVEQLLVGMVDHKVVSPKELKELADKIHQRKNKES